MLSYFTGSGFLYYPCIVIEAGPGYIIEKLLFDTINMQFKALNNVLGQKKHSWKALAGKYIPRLLLK